MSRNRTDGVGGGRRRQSAVPQRTGFRAHALRAHGLNVRAVVTQTYVQLDGTSPLPSSTFDNVTGVYCDVLTYSNIEGWRTGPLARVPVQQHLGMHGGHLWVPKAARVDVTGGELNLATADPQNLDGDHVRIDFLEDDLSRPVIAGRITHPRVGQGNENLVAVGHRQKLKEADGLVDFWKHNGTYYGVDKDGNFVIDTTRAHSGETSTTGAEVPKDDATHGALTVKVNSKNTFTIVGVDTIGANKKFEMTLKDGELHVKLDDGESLKITGKDGATTTLLGDAAVSAAIAEKMKDLWNALVQWATTTMTVSTGMGPSGPSTVAPPLWDEAIASSKLKFPTG